MVMKSRFTNKSEVGTTMVEFAITAGVFFMLILGIIEFSRLLYTHNALTDATRRGARYAALHPANASCVPNVVVYGEANIDPSSCAPTNGIPIVPNLTPAMVDTVWVGADLDNDPSTPPTSYGMNLGTATVTIGATTPYQFTLSIPFFRTQFNMPRYTATMTAESAGNIPADL